MSLIDGLEVAGRTMGRVMEALCRQVARVSGIEAINAKLARRRRRQNLELAALLRDAGMHSRAERLERASLRRRA